MKILFDVCCPRSLRKFLPEHEIITVQEMGWRRLRNGDLLAHAQTFFDVMTSADSNIEYQQRLPDYDIGLIVLRAVTGKLPELLTLIPYCRQAIQEVQKGESLYLFTDEAWECEQRKGKIKQRWQPKP